MVQVREPDEKSLLALCAGVRACVPYFPSFAHFDAVTPEFRERGSGDTVVVRPLGLARSTGNPKLSEDQR